MLEFGGEQLQELAHLLDFWRPALEPQLLGSAAYVLRSVSQGTEAMHTNCMHPWVKYVAHWSFEIDQVAHVSLLKLLTTCSLLTTCLVVLTNTCSP